MSWTLVTGGAKRVGAGICKALAKRHYDIVIHYNTSQQDAIQTQKECQSFGVHAEIMQGDFSTKESTQDFIERYHQNFSDIKNLINNVGNYFIRSIQETTLDCWQEMFQTNVFAPIALIQGFLTHLKTNKGSIINLGVAGINHIPSDQDTTCYRMTKLGLWMLTKSLAKELAKDHVNVNMVSPGRLENSVDAPWSDPRNIPMGRNGTVDEVARVVAFLLEEGSSYITGQNIEVAGGARL